MPIQPIRNQLPHLSQNSFQGRTPLRIWVIQAALLVTLMIPVLTYAQDNDPFAKQAQDNDPFAKQAQDNDPFAKQATERDPFAKQDQDDNPFDHPQDKPTQPTKVTGTDSNIPAGITPTGGVAITDDRAMEKLLEKSFPMDFHEVMFAEFRELVRESAGVNLYLHYSAIDDSLTDDDLITFRCDETMSLGNALESLLEPFNADYVVEQGMVKIISRDEAASPEFLVRRIIDTRKLIGLLTQERLALYANDPEPPRRWEISMIVEEELVALIRETVNNDNWKENGGSGTLVSINGLLVVNNQRRDVNQVQKLLKELLRNLTSKE